MKKRWNLFNFLSLMKLLPSYPTKSLTKMRRIKKIAINQKDVCGKIGPFLNFVFETNIRSLESPIKSNADRQIIRRVFAKHPSIKNKCLIPLYTLRGNQCWITSSSIPLTRCTSHLSCFRNEVYQLSTTPFDTL